MSSSVVITLRIVIALALLGSVVVQGVMLALLWTDLEDARPEVRFTVVALAFLGVVALQVVAVCTWRLLTMVRRGTVFSFAAFRYVDVICAAVASGAVVLFGFAVLAAYSNRTTPGDEVAPGLVGLVCGLAMVVGGVALLVRVLRALLAQAVALDDQTRRLQAELSGVI